jgi:hypothetical protein
MERTLFIDGWVDHSPKSDRFGHRASIEIELTGEGRRPAGVGKTRTLSLAIDEAYLTYPEI